MTASPESGDLAELDDGVGPDEDVAAAVLVEPDRAGPPGAGDELAVQPAAVLQAHLDVMPFEAS